MSESVADYDYAYPPEAVAQVPAARRDEARLLIVPRAMDPDRAANCSAGAAALVIGAPLAADSTARAPFSDRGMRDLPKLLRPGDLLVLNDTRVLPARLLARRRGTGGRVAVLVLRVRGRQATVLLGARGTLQPGELLDVAGDTWRLLRAQGDGRYEIEVERGRELHALLADIGRMPLPPYIERGAETDARDALDRERYQTVFARGVPRPDGAATPGDAVAAPTAGLHFTPELLAALATRAVRIATLRLDVGEGTFRPLRGVTLAEHVMHSESYEIPAALASAFADTRAAGGRVVAVGTTVVRALESAALAAAALPAAGGSVTTLAAGPATTSLFIRPGFRFRVVDALLTNFHQPRSTLLVLVSAFAGGDTIRAAYSHALSRGYRLFSYGDAMLIG